MITMTGRRCADSLEFAFVDFQVMQALSHFSYHCSAGQFVLCDLQGGVYRDGVILTDPVILSRTQTYGPTDLGVEGMETFFARHQCGDYCRSHWQQPRIQRAHFDERKGTTMVHVPTQYGKSPLSNRNYY